MASDEHGKAQPKALIDASEIEKLRAAIRGLQVEANNLKSGHAQQLIEPQITHWDDCYTVHHACALQRLENEQRKCRIAFKMATRAADLLAEAQENKPYCDCGDEIKADGACGVCRSELESRVEGLTAERDHYRLAAQKALDAARARVCDHCQESLEGELAFCPKCATEGVDAARVEEREAFRAGFMATISDPKRGIPWSFDGPAAADREPEAWEAWMALRAHGEEEGHERA